MHVLDTPVLILHDFDITRAVSRNDYNLFGFRKIYISNHAELRNVMLEFCQMRCINIDKLL